MPLERVSQGFKDLSMSFQTSPLTNDVLALKNASAIARSVRNIVVTRPGERPFNPDFGTDITGLLFEVADSETASVIEDQIKYSITTFERRVELRNVNVIADHDNNQFDVVIEYDIIGLDISTQRLEFILLGTR